MAKAGTFKLVIKNGNSGYHWNEKTGNYSTKTEDSVSEFDNLAEALAEFLWSVSDEYNSNKVSLVFVPSKKKDKK